MKENTKVTKVITVFETFAGIGSQHKAISNINKSFKVVKTSEWDSRAIISYALIHNKKTFNQELKKLEKISEQEINKRISKYQFSLNSKSPSDLRRKYLEFKKVLLAANTANHNHPDITKVRGTDIKGIDLLTYSFPCQGLSIANMGRDKGINKDVESASNLIWEIWRILKEAKENKVKLPKYLLMENVKNLVGPKHNDSYLEWKSFLKKLGYETYTFKVNALNHGAVQGRIRLFGISILNHKRKWSDQEFLDAFNKKYGKTLTHKEREIKYLKILSSSNKYPEELESATPNNTKSRRMMARENKDLLLDINPIKNRQYIFNTLTTKQDRNPNIGMITNLKEYDGRLEKRFITPREGYQIMEFTSSDFDAIKPYWLEGILTKESLYRQSGNSIVVSVLESIFKFIHDFERGVYE